MTPALCIWLRNAVSSRSGSNQGSPEEPQTSGDSAQQAQRPVRPAAGSWPASPKLPGPTPPAPPKHPKTITQRGRVRSDEYAWMKDDNGQALLHDPSAVKEEVRAHLTAENAYLKAMLAGTED